MATATGTTTDVGFDSEVGFETGFLRAGAGDGAGEATKLDVDLVPVRVERVAWSEMGAERISMSEEEPLMFGNVSRDEEGVHEEVHSAAAGWERKIPSRRNARVRTRCC